VKKVLLSLLAALLLGYGLLQSSVVQRALLTAALPEWPQWPEAVTHLAQGGDGEIYFATQTPHDFDVLLREEVDKTPTTGLGYLTLPERLDGSSSVPAMILLPGSGGISAGREHEYAAWLNENGIAVFVVEYYLPRGATKETDYLLKTAAVTEFDIISDAYAALQLLSSHPSIDGERIGVMGFSYGGMATRFAMDERFRRSLAPQSAGFALHIDVYGPCFQNLQTADTNGSPLLTLRGTEDKSNDLEACVLRENELRSLGVEVEAIVYPGAGHSWENDAPQVLSSSPYISGCEVTYDSAGYAYLNGQPHTRNAADTDRLDRIRGRLASGIAFKDCLQYGYLVGSDDTTQEKANAAILRFLQRHFFQLVN